MPGGYRIGPTRLTNFGPFADVMFDPSRPGLTVVEGEFVGHGCDSNGAGKSYLIDAIAWCLYGRTLRERVAKDDVVRLLFRNVGGDKLEVMRDKKGAPVRPEEGCTVQVHLVGGPTPVRVTRYQGHPTLGNRVELHVDGTDVTLGRDAMTQQAIEQIIGLDYRTFVNSVAFGAGDDVRSFFSATDAERKAIMERILSLEVYTHALQTTRAELSTKQGEADTAQRKLDTLKETLATQERVLAQTMAQSDITAKAARLKRARRVARTLEGRFRQLSVRVKVARKHMRIAEVRAQEAQNTYRTEQTAFERQRAALERKLSQATQERFNELAEAKAARAHASRSSRMSGQACATCGQQVDPRFAKRAAADAAQRCRVHDAAAAEIEQRVKQLTRRLEALEEPPRPDTTDYDRARTRWRKRKARAELIESKWEAAKESEREFERELDEAQARAKTIAQDVRTTKNGIATLTKARAALETELQHLTFWMEGFGNAGIKSFLIEAEVPVINKIATCYAQRLLGSGSRVQLSATRELKGGGQREELVVHANIPGCTVSYANASKGQKKRLDLCILLAFRDVVSRRSAKAFEQFFADELFDGLDETGEEFVIELLRDLSSKCPVTLVTHSSRLKSVGDRVLSVRHENGVSNLTTSRATASA